MRTDVIGLRYRLGSVVTCTPEATTWDACDTWLDERVLVVTPEPGCDERFAALAGAVLDRSSPHLVGLYDIGTGADDFVVFSVPTATLSEERAPREEDDVLVAGRMLGDALEALHGRSVVHGHLHPGSVVIAESGEATLSPWPLAPRPHNWSGPGGFGTDPDEPRDASARDDVRALGAVLLGALAGPPVISSEQVGNIERELAGHAPNAVTIVDRALTPPAGGGYAVAAELRDDCAAVLAGRPVAAAVPDLPVISDAAPDSDASVATSEGRRAALVLAATGAALIAGFGVAGSIGAGPRPVVHQVATPASGCAARHAASRCTGPGDNRAAAAATPAAATPAGATPARFTAHGAAARSARGSSTPATVSSPAASPRATAASAPASSTTTTPAPSTTTSSGPTTTTTAPAVTTTTAAGTTTTTAPSTTTSSSADAVQAGPRRDGPGPGDGPGTSPGY